MRWVRLKSSAVKRLAYDEAARELQLLFDGGRRYRYFDVTPQEVLKLLQSDSIGEFVNHQIKPKHAFEEVSRPGRRKPLDPPHAAR